MGPGPHRPHCEEAKCGPGFCSPEAAIKNGKREKILYIPCISSAEGKPDYLSVVDVDPKSSSFCKVIYRLPFPLSGDGVKDELHHSGWNACSSRCGDAEAKRDKLIFPCLNSDRIYVVDLSDDEKKPKHFKTVEASALHDLDLSAPHTSHCLGDGNIMISTMGDKQGNSKGQLLLLSGKDFKVKGTWSETSTKYGYDFWYQPKFDVMITSEWGAPKAFKKGLDPSTLADNYGHHLNIWSWEKRTLVDTIDLGTESGWMPLETRFLHNPNEPQGFVGCALSSTIFRFFQDSCGGKWKAEKVISIPIKKVANWWVGLTDMPGVITDIILSMDDKFLYFSNWVHGDIRQYDISNPAHPVLKGQVFVGGSIVKGGPVIVEKDEELSEQPPPLKVKDTLIQGGPQMLQLSLDGKRLYVTTSLFSPWDKQFYPELQKTGSCLLQIDVDTAKGGMKINKDFLVDYGNEPDGPVLAHEIRYPGGDCTSDIFLPTS